MMTFDIQNNPAQALSNKYRIIWMERDPDQNILVEQCLSNKFCFSIEQPFSFLPVGTSKVFSILKTAELFALCFDSVQF
jgi:hypothetical protein